MSKTIEVGIVGKPHGLKGHVYVRYFGEATDCLQGELFLHTGSLFKEIRAKTCKFHQGKLVVLFEGIEDRTAAEAIRGYTLHVPEEALPPLEDDEIYLNEILGLVVFLEEEQDALGVIEHVLFLGEQETWVIKTPDQREILLPAVPEFVADIDLEQERVVITPPEGLLELY